MSVLYRYLKKWKSNTPEMIVHSDISIFEAGAKTMIEFLRSQNAQDYEEKHGLISADDWAEFLEETL